MALYMLAPIKAYGHASFSQSLALHRLQQRLSLNFICSKLTTYPK